MYVCKNTNANELHIVQFRVILFYTKKKLIWIRLFGEKFNLRVVWVIKMQKYETILVLQFRKSKGYRFIQTLRLTITPTHTPTLSCIKISYFYSHSSKLEQNNEKIILIWKYPLKNSVHQVGKIKWAKFFFPTQSFLFSLKKISK